MTEEEDDDDELLSADERANASINIMRHRSTATVLCLKKRRILQLGGKGGRSQQQRAKLKKKNKTPLKMARRSSLKCWSDDGDGDVKK